MAKAWNLSSKSTTVAGREISVILLGESGRGRQLTSIPTEQGIENGNAVSVTLAETKANGLKTKPSIKVGTSAGTTWAARISTEGSYIRGAQGNVSFDPSQAPKTPVLVARGHGAFGDAGRTGSWDDVILLVEDGTVLRVKPSRGDAYFLYFEEAQVSRLELDQLGLLGLDFDLENRARI